MLSMKLTPQRFLAQEHPFSNIHKYSFRGFIGMYLKRTDILFHIKTNVMGFDGIALINKSWFPYNAFINIVCHLFLFHSAHALCCNGYSLIVI